jgi:predicted DNA binding CopG/RHH family protein
MDKEEREVSEAYEAGKMKLEDPSKELLGMLARAGENTFRKDKRINIRLTSHDLVGIQRKAAQKGIPYQALISGLIHQYVEGDIQEKQRVNQSA